MADRVVVGPVVVLPNTAGLQQYYYQGATLPDGLVEERVLDAIASGLVSETKSADELTVDDLDVAAAGDRFRGLGAATGEGVSMLGAPAPSDDSSDESDGDAQPPKAANKAAWVDYAVAQGADRDEAEAMNKDDLIATYGA